MLSGYRTIIAAVVGVLLMLVNKYAGIDIGDHADTIIDVILGIGTVASVVYYRRKANVTK